MLQFVADQFFVIALAVVAAASLVILWSRRKRLRASVAADPSGIRSAVTTGVGCAALLAFANVCLAAAAFIPISREGFWAQYLVLPFLYLASLFAFAALDLYAVLPPRPGNRAAARGLGILGAALMVVAGGGTGIAISSAANREAQAAEQVARAEESQAVKVRSAGLSMVIAVVDAQLGESTVNGRIVSSLTLDVTLRSTTDIQLQQADAGFGYHWINVAPPGTGFPIQPEGGLGLPVHIRAGSNVTYRLEVPIDELRLEPADEFTAGTWTASLFLAGSSGAPGSPPMYRTETSFIVPEAP